MKSTVFLVLAGAALIVLVARTKVRAGSPPWNSRPTELAVLLRGVAGLMTHEDRIEASDFILVLNGNIRVRAGGAADLYRRGVAPTILIASTAPTSVSRAAHPQKSVSELIRDELHRLGVPVEVVQIIPFPGGVENTRDEARAIRAFLREHPARRVTVVTSDYHTGRARLILRQELGPRILSTDIRMAAARDTQGVSAANWWRSDTGIRLYSLEFLKMACAFVRCT